MDLINIADGCLNKILGFREEIYNENLNLENEIETQKKILDYNARAINQLIQDQFEINDKIADTDKKLKIEELKQVNLPFEIQSYMDYLLKENKDKYEIYIEQIEDYKELYHIDIKIMKENKSVMVTFLKNNQQINLNFSNPERIRVTYEKNIDVLIENCKYESMDELVNRFTDNSTINRKNLKELILLLNDLF